MKKSLLIAMLVVASINLHSQNAWKSVNIQGMGFVTGVIANPSQPNEVFVRTDVGGIFGWDHVNQKWDPLLDSTNTTWNYMQVESFAIDKNTSGAQTTIYAAANGGSFQGILKSDDRGSSWVKTNFPDSVYIFGNGFWRHTGERLMIDPQNNNIVYFGSRKDGLFISVDTGNNWAAINSNWTNGGTGGSSISGGISFVAIDPRPTEIVSSPNRSKNLYIGVIGNTAQSYSMYKSIDGGLNWSAMTGAGAPPNAQNPVRGVVATDGTLYVTTTSNAASSWQGFPNANGRIYKYSPITDNWSDITPLGCNSGPLTFGCVSWAALAVDPNNPNKIYAANFGEGIRDIYYSIDGGINWKIVTDDGPSAYPVNTHQQAQYNIPDWGYAGDGYKFSWSGGIAVDPFNSSKVYVTTGYAVHVTEDITSPTVTWNTPMNGLEMLVVNVVKVPAKINGADLITGVADMAGFRHSDKSVVPNYKFLPNAHGITTSIDWMQSNPNVIVKVGGDQGTNGLNSDVCNGCGFSVDNGITWTPFNIPPAQGWGNYTDGNIAIARNAPSTSALNLVWFPTAKQSGGNANKPVYSFNSGSTWTACNFDFGDVTSNSCTDQYWFNTEMVASDKNTDNTFYAFVPNYFGSNSNYCQLFRSTDGGQNFKKIYSFQKQWDINGQSIGWNENYRVTLKPNPLVAGDVWIKIGTRLFRCENALAPVTANQPDIQRVNEAVITRVQNFGWGAPYPTSSNPTLFIAGTINGIESVFRSTDLGVTWTDILMGEPVSLANISSIDGDMNRPGRVFLGTSNRGVFYFEDPIVSNIEHEDPFLSASNIFIYPNPSTGNFTISIENEITGNIVLNIHDLNGEILQSQQVFKKQKKIESNVQLNNLANGIYFLSLRYENGLIEYKKIVVGY